MTSALASEAAQKDFVDLMAACYHNPKLFILECLRITPWFDVNGNERYLRRWQERVCELITQQLHSGNVKLKALLRTCHGAGKTWLLGALVLWFLYTRPNSRILTTALTWRGVNDLLWPEISKLWRGSIFRQLDLGRPLTTSLVIRDTWYAIGASSDKPENLEGHQSDTAAMRVVDEAKAYPQENFDATEGMLSAPETLDVWISTPSIMSGAFYDRDVGKDESIIRVSVDIDELVADGIPGKAEWKADREKEWGVDSILYRSRALAQYIDAGVDTLFPSLWIDRAMAQTWEVDGLLQPIAGLDVAGSVEGDQNALAVKVGPDADRRVQNLYLFAWHEADTTVTKQRAIMLAHGATLRVDGIGIGKGVLDMCRADNNSVLEYRASNKPLDELRFLNKKAEDAWHVRELLEKELLRLIPRSHPLAMQLKHQMAAMRYEVLSSGKIRVIDPPDSPDLADALIIACSKSTAGIIDWYEQKLRERGIKVA